jgi:HSP20 family protein
MLYRFDDFDRTFAAMDQLRRRMDRPFDDYESPVRQDATRAERLHEHAAWPRVTWTDAGQNLVVHAELPGLGEKDVQLSLEKDVLTITGERKSVAPQGYLVHRQERAPVKFTRSYSLPCKVDPETSAATLKNGVMTITLTKVPEAQPRQIPVRST